MTIADPVQPPLARTLPSDASRGGLAFHRLVFARNRSGWWTPLVVGLLGLAFYVVFIALLVAVVVMITLAASGGQAVIPAVSAGMLFDLTDPLMLAAILATLVLMLPAYALASLIVNGKRVGLISSAAGRLRWRWMLLCGVAAVILSAVLTGLSLLLPPEWAGDPGTVIAPAQNPAFLASLLVIVLVVPFQAAAEEYVFRGYLQQSIGRWLRHPLFAILLPVPFFVLGHAYDPLGQAGVALFAVAAGWLTWRTGGLEAAIALHVVNNLLAFLTALAGFSDVNAAAPGVASFAFSALLIGGYAAAIELLARRGRLPRTLVLRDPVSADTSAPLAP